MSRDCILITVSGPDRPGITSSLMKIINDAQYEILDMGQSVTHGLLSLSILISSQNEDSSESPILKDLLFSAKQKGLQLDFEIIQSSKVKGITGEKFVLSCVGSENLKPAFLQDISESLAQSDINILRIDNVNGGLNFKSLEITTTISQDIDIKKIKEILLSISNSHHVDMAFLKDNIYRRSKRLIVFDMDSTLIQAEVIDELAHAHGVGEEISEITERAMNGELDFAQSLNERVGKLKGLSTSRMQEVADNLPLTPGVETFIKTVKKLGYKVALISGGFTYFADILKDKLGLDYAFANELEISNGELTGNVKGQIVDAEQKALLLKIIAQQEKISLEQVVAIGDGANDLPMLSEAGLGIAFHAKDIVRKKADNHMSHGPMTTILYFLGIRESDQQYE